MYEPKNGPKRLARALHDASFSERDMAILTRVLNYHAPQLGDDIRALYDLLITNARAEEDPSAAVNK